jgi:UDP-arabinose 4-epimerase
MKNILVTGGAGYIGSHAAKALAQAGFNPVVFDNFVYGNRWAVRWGPLVEGDIGDRKALLEAFNSHRIDAVMHFAAFAYVGESVTKPEIYFDNNVVKALNLLEAIRLAGIKTIVFSSSCATYGTPQVMPITEDTSQLPVNPYGETKLIIERALHWYGIAHHINWAALRYFNAAGADPECEIGEDHNPETHLIPLVLDAAAGLRPAIDIYGTDYPTRDGSCIRDYIHVTDLADAHVRALQHLAKVGGAFKANLGTGVGHTVLEVIAAVERVTGRDVPQRRVARREGDPAELVADPSRANALLGWLPQRSDLPSIVSTAWAWHLRHHQARHRSRARDAKIDAERS